MAHIGRPTKHGGDGSDHGPAWLALDTKNPVTGTGF